MSETIPMSAKFTAPELNPRTVAVDRPVPSAFVDETEKFIAVIEDGTRSRPLPDYIRKHKSELDEMIATHGGVLFRGFAVETPAQFRDVVTGFGREQLPYLERAAARTEVVSGVFTSTEFSSSSWIELHHEMSFAQRIPERIFFYADTLAETGGETPVADEYLATARISPAILKAFSERDVLYTRNFRSEIDMDWRSAFQTDDRADVEAYCRTNDISFEWLGEDHLRTRQRQKAFALEPGTDRTLFCNHAHIFHRAALNPALLAALVDAYGEDLPRNVQFGDGSPIPDEMILEIRGIYEDCLRIFPWGHRDVMILNNVRCLHGRAPFTGRRTTLVSMTNLISRRV